MFHSVLAFSQAQYYLDDLNATTEIVKGDVFEPESLQAAFAAHLAGGQAAERDAFSVVLMQKIKCNFEAWIANGFVGGRKLKITGALILGQLP